MPRKTEEVYELVKEVLKTIPAPYSEDITDEVCFKIEKSQDWKRQYDNLCAQLSKHTVNKAFGYWTKRLTGRVSGVVVKANKSKIINDYTKLI